MRNYGWCVGLMFLIIPMLFGCRSPLPLNTRPRPWVANAKPALSTAELKSLLVARGFSSVWDKGISIWKTNDSRWDMAFFEDPVSVQSLACYARIHLVHILREPDGFSIDKTGDSDQIQLSLCDCTSMPSHEYLRPVHHLGWRYRYTDDEIEDVVTRLYSVLTKRNDPSIVIDEIWPGLKNDFRNLKPQDLNDVTITMFGNIRANFFNKALARSNRYLHLVIKKPVSGVTHIEVSWEQYDVLE